MLQKMRHFKESECQPLRVGSLPFLTQYHLTSRIRAFAHTHPEVELMLEECEENELMDGLQSGRFGSCHCTGFHDLTAEISLCTSRKGIVSV